MRYMLENNCYTIILYIRDYRVIDNKCVRNGERKKTKKKKEKRNEKCRDTKKS